jgi:2-oxoglutarate ferredoxin oxidoreductase subunit gamma
MQRDVIMAGFGGQGILLIGKMLAYAGMHEGMEVSWLPSYGPEMRGGTAYCTVVVSDEPIGSPIISTPKALVVLNRPSMDKFAPRVKSGGTIIVNSSLIEVTSERDDVDELLVPANDIAIECGSPRSTNMVMLGAFVGRTKIVQIKNLKAFVGKKFSGKVAEINVKAMMAGHRLGCKR